MGSPLPGTPLVWSPRGASDTLDSSTAFSGAMARLVNLIPDPSTRDLWQCRPAAIELTDFTGFTTPTFISCMKVIGTRVYGMVSTALNVGQDEPFVYDLMTNTFVAITGVTGANTPVSPAQTGAWEPPTLDLIGAQIIVTHPGFNGGGGAFFGVIDITTPSAPTWTATNTAPNALPSVPQWVVNFNGRAFFLVNPSGIQPAAYMSDQLLPTVITNANQILTFDDNVELTCAAGLPLSNQLGGVIQSLMIFKGVTNIYQVTGDYAGTGSDILRRNTLNVATGTLSPLALATTKAGLAFLAPDGIRVIDWGAVVSNPVGNSGDGITVPFINQLVPSRACGMYNSGVYRLQVQNGNETGNPQQQWWFDLVRGLWSGPHTLESALLQPYSGTFITTIQGAGAKLFQSDPVQSSTSTYEEDGAALTWNYQTPMLPDTDQMNECVMLQTTIHLALVSGGDVTVIAFDQDGEIFDTVTISPTGSPTIWGNFQWGQALWQGAQNALYPRPLNWSIPLVFRRLGLSATANSAQGIKVGRTHMRYNLLNYLQQGG